MDTKVDEFTQAIQKYLNNPVYRRFEVLVSILIVTLQAITLFNFACTAQHLSFCSIFFALLTAYIMTDFVNGLVHMYMDNNTHYTSIVGPYIAAFHLHHAKYVYRTRIWPRVYFDESGTKFWLLVYLFFFVGIQLTVTLDAALNMGLVAFGIFSSLAELSHYWCHNAIEKNKIVLWLQRKRILLSKDHHKAHHGSDNTQYAFLNGVSDPLINLIAKYFCKGYKNHADKHTQAYCRHNRILGISSSETGLVERNELISTPPRRVDRP